MSEGNPTVYLYLFPSDGKDDTDGRLKLAAERYFADVGAPSRSPERFNVTRTPRGKPQLCGCSDLSVSVSHSGDWFICAFAHFPVGIDLQKHETDSGETVETAKLGFIKKAELFFHKNEAEFIKEDPYSRFFTVWTAKESYVKYTGTGIDDKFSETSVVPCDRNEWGRIAGADPVLWQTENACFYKTVKDGYTFSVSADRTFDVKLEKMI